MSLRDWVENGWLIKQRTDYREIADILAAAERDLRECMIDGLSADWKLNIAYTAVLRAAHAALSASGYRASRDQHHFRVIQSLVHTIKADAMLIGQIDRFRMKRNRHMYDHAGMISEYEAACMVEIASSIMDMVVSWLKAEHPEQFGR